MNQSLLLFGFFAAVMAGVAVAGYYFLYRSSAASVAGLSLDAKEPVSARQLLADSLRSLGEAGPGKPGGENPMRRKLHAAGYRSPSAVATYSGIVYSSSAILGIIVGAAVLVSQQSLSAALLTAICAAGFGYLLPNRILQSQISARKRRLVEGLPVALDLLVLSVEAGQALDQSIFDSSREIRTAYPDLADELLTVSLALRASVTREQVFRDFGNRSNDLEFKKLANLLIDSDRFGSSLGPTLRTHARYLRIRRRQYAQERARKIGVKLVFPIFFLIFPSVLLVTLGPAAIAIMTALKPMMDMK
jgi:tight adherence protein C